MAPLPSRRGAYVRRATNHLAALSSRCHELKACAETVLALRTCGRMRRLGCGCVNRVCRPAGGAAANSFAGCAPKLSTASIPSSSTVARASGEQLRERAKRGADPHNSRGDFPSGDAAASRTELSTQGRTAEVAVAPSPSVEQHPTRWRANTENTFVGGWAYDTGEYRQGQDRGAPLVIGTHSAKTASGECDFRSVTREDASRWRIVALCSREGESWSAHGDLKLVGSNLTWSSERGTANYVRCTKH